MAQPVDENVARLEAQAEQGRGLWIGLFPSPRASLVIGEHVNDDPHITLAHLGKGKTKLVAIAASAGWVLAETFAPITAKIHGTARLEQWRSSAVVALLSSDRLDAARRSLGELLRARDVKMSDTFGWTPHLTAAKDLSTGSRVVLPRVEGDVRFEHVTIVCGDERIHYPFLGTR